MTELHRWVDELPLESPDRELLLVGKEARAPEGSRDRGWQALVVALGAASTTAALTAPAAGAVAGATKTAIAAKTTTALQLAEAAMGTAQATAAAKGALGGASLLIGLKSIAVGFGLGLGVLGVTEVAQRVVDRAPAHSVSAHASASTPHRLQKPSHGTASRPLPTNMPTEATEASAPQAVAPDHALPASSTNPPLASASVDDEVIHRTPTNTTVPRELVLAGSSASEQQPMAAVQRGGETGVAIPRAGESEAVAVVAKGVTEQHPMQVAPHSNDPSGTAKSKASALADRARTTSLAEQARELAQIQRLIDAGATTEALRRLEASLDTNTDSGLAEERDALHIRALIKAQRTTQAALLAKRFIQRYPNSPQTESMRRFLQPE